MKFVTALIPFLIGLDEPATATPSSSSSHDDNDGTSVSFPLSSVSSSPSNFHDDANGNKMKQRKKLRFHSSPPSELKNRQQDDGDKEEAKYHRINGDGSTGSEQQYEAEIDFGRLRHNLPKDLGSDKASLRQLEFESREEYCANLCPMKRPKIQNYYDYHDMKYIVSACINSVSYDDRRLDHLYPASPVCPEYLDYSNVQIGCWDTSAVTDMQYAFYYNDPNPYSKLKFNKPLNCWDVSNVTTMNRMFFAAENFDQPLGDWNVVKVKDMSGMFFWAKSFNQPLDDWNVASVNDMNKMFSWAESFDQPLDDWNLTKLTRMSYMFARAKNFNQPINNWNVEKVLEASRMFYYAPNFNQPINDWNVAKVTNMWNMFTEAKSFDQPLDDWDVAKVTTTVEMFAYATNFNQPINNWNVTKVTYMSEMFLFAENFNQPLDDWDVARVTDMYGTIAYASEFNQCISSWAEKTTSTVDTTFMLAKTSCPNWLTYMRHSPDPDIGPWCQGAKDGCVIAARACVNSAEFDCSKYLENSKNPGKKCGKKIKKKGGKRVKDLCPVFCKQNLCTCVDSVKKFSIKGKDGDAKKISCAKLFGKKKCKEKTVDGFAVKTICPNKCKNIKKCVN